MSHSNQTTNSNWTILFIGWIIAVVSSLGSLFFSEIMELPPCSAFYHYLIYSGIIPENLQPCSQGVSCSETYLDLFGFLTIPMLSLMSFTAIIALLLLSKRKLSK